MATTPKLELPPTTNLAGVNDDADSAVEVGADRDQRLLDEKKVLISPKAWSSVLINVKIPRGCLKQAKRSTLLG